MGFAISHEDDENWALSRPGHPRPVVLPKGGRLVALDVLDRALNAAGIDNQTYLDFLAEIPEPER